MDKLYEQFSVEDGDLFEKYNSIWDKFRGDIKNQFVSKPVYNKNFLKTKFKSYGGDVTDFYDKGNPMVKSNYTCLTVMSLDSALKKDKNYYLQSFLEQCRYIEKK